MAAQARARPRVTSATRVTSAPIGRAARPAILSGSPGVRGTGVFRSQRHQRFRRSGRARRSRSGRGHRRLGGHTAAASACRSVDLLDPADHAAVGQRAVEHRGRRHRLRQRHPGPSVHRDREARRDPREPRPRGHRAVRDDRERRAPRRDERDQQAGGRRVHAGVRRAAGAGAGCRGIRCRRRLLRRHLRRPAGRGDRQGRRRIHLRAEGCRGPVPAVPLRDPLRDVGRRDQGRRRGRRQRVVGGARAVPPVLPRDDRAAGVRGRPDDRHRRQRRLHGVQGRRPRHEPDRRTVSDVEPGRCVSRGHEQQHRGRRRARRLRGLQPEPRQSRRLGRDPDRGGRHGHRSARGGAADRPDQRRHDRQRGVGGQRPGRHRRDLPGRPRRVHALDLAAAARLPGGLREGRHRGGPLPGRGGAERAERQHPAAADDRRRRGHARTRPARAAPCSPRTTSAAAASPRTRR